MHFQISSVAVLLLAANVNAHGAIVRAVGDMGGNGTALGIDPNTPRDGTRRNPFQQDSTRFSEQRGDNAAGCGSTLAAGDNDAEALMAMSGGTLPQVKQGGQVMMTLHQVNSDGAGPYTCEVDETATGGNWVPITVTENVAGRNSRNRQGSETDHPLTAQLNADTNCSGTVAGQSNVCMVRCMNAANAGPFGGCVPVQQVATNQQAATGNATDADTGATDTGATDTDTGASTAASPAAAAAGNAAGAAAALNGDRNNGGNRNNNGAGADDDDDEEDDD